MSLSFYVALKGRLYHRLGDLKNTPLNISREVSNSKDENALIVRDSKLNTIGFIDKEAATYISPLLRAGFFRDLDLVTYEKDEKKESQVLCKVTILLEQEKVAEFHSLKKIESTNNLFEKTFNSTGKNNNVEKKTFSGGFTKASELRRIGSKSPLLIESYSKIMSAVSRTRSEASEFVKNFHREDKHESDSTKLTKKSNSSNIHHYFSRKQVKLNQEGVDKLLPNQSKILFMEICKMLSPMKWFDSRDLVCALRILSKEFKQFIDAILPNDFSIHRQYHYNLKQNHSLGLKTFKIDLPREAGNIFQCCNSLERSALIKSIIETKRPYFWMTEEIVYCILGYYLHLGKYSENELVSKIAFAIHDELYHSIRLNYPNQKLKLTMEQQCIINLNYDINSIICVNAFAGSGKTTLLLELSKTKPNKKILYLCFNKSVQLEAEKRFPKNVECRTIHSLAFDLTGYSPYVSLQNDDFDAIKRWYFKNYLSEADDQEETLDVLIFQVIEKLRKFLNSQSVTAQDSQIYNLWESMRKGEIPMTFAGVLKECAILKKNSLNYDIIMLDEAQDCNPCALEIVLSQENSTRIFVGDGNQAIYGFTDAKNALKILQDSQTFYLTRTFRFSLNLAAMVNSFLRCCSPSSNFQFLLGASTIPFKISKPIETPSEFAKRINSVDLGKKKSCCFISRTNVKCLEMMVEVLNKDSTIKLCMVGGLKSAHVNELMEISQLMQQSDNDSNNTSELYQNINFKKGNSFISKFSHIDSLYKACINRGMQEMISIIHTVKRLGSERTIEMINLLKQSNRVVKDKIEADLLFSTVHRVKGLEFDGVYLADDFDLVEVVTSPTSRVRWERIEEETRNLLYVAFTRAKQELVLNPSLSFSAAFDDIVGKVINKSSRVNIDICSLCSKRNTYKWTLHHHFDENHENSGRICEQCEILFVNDM